MVARKGVRPAGRRQPRQQAQEEIAPEIPVITADNMPPLMKVTLVIPVDHEEKVYDFCQTIYRLTGVKIHLTMDEFDAVGAEVTEAEPAPTPRSVALRQQAQVEVPRNSVVYTVTKKGASVSQGNNQVVYSFLSTNGPQSARTIWESTGLKQKAVESAIYALRTSKVIASVAAQ